MHNNNNNNNNFKVAIEPESVDGNVVTWKTRRLAEIGKGEELHSSSPARQPSLLLIYIPHHPVHAVIQQITTDCWLTIHNHTIYRYLYIIYNSAIRHLQVNLLKVPIIYSRTLCRENIIVSGRLFPSRRRLDESRCHCCILCCLQQAR